MSKSEYFRKLIVKANSENDIVHAFNSLQSWSYNGTNNINGIDYYILTNLNENAKVLFTCNGSNCILSINVVPIEMNGDEKIIYRYGYDFSENQATSINDDILFDLCKEINNSIDNVYCGIVPSERD